MKRFFARLGYAHAHLWSQGGFYRIALVLGPAPLVGLILGAVIWSSLGAVNRTDSPVAPWVNVALEPARMAAPDPISLVPWRPLPELDSDGTPVGYTRGWLAAAHAITDTPTMDVEIKPQALAPLAINSAVADMTEILADGPKSGLFVAVAGGALVVREPGHYRVSAWLDRSAGRPTRCVTRLILGGQRIVWSLNVGGEKAFRRSFDPVTLDLKRGLYRISYAFGCWDGVEMVELGRLSVVMERPGETSFTPIRPEEVVR